MSDFYTPRFDGIHSEVALPGRCPMTGQFVSGNEVLDDEIKDIPFGMHLCSQHDSAAAEQFYLEANESREDAENRYWSNHEFDPDLHEDDQISNGNEWYRYDFDDSRADLATDETINSYLEHHTDYAEDIGEKYERLPLFEARKHVLNNWELESHRDYRYYVNGHGNRTQKGRPSRFNKKRRQDRVRKDEIRAARANTHRQMDHNWLAEMVEPTYSSFESVMYSERREDVWDAEAHLNEVNEELWDTYSYELLLNEQHWEWHHPGPMTEALQNCHGFSGHDPVEEKQEQRERELNNHLLFDQYDDCCGFWGEYDSYYDDYPSEWDEYDDPMDRYEFGILTEEDEVYFDAEASALEAEAEALEAAFEHIAVGNATGRRMQLAARAA